MQEYAKSNRLTIKMLLFFMISLFIAFLPVSTFLFFIKNDAFTGYFPAKFFISESLLDGHLPLWNPYINYGFPQYADMNAGYWSPITWLIASTVGYNAYSFTLEILGYILFGGIGMYALMRFFKLSLTTALIAGISYICCGFNIGHLQHVNWISGAAFLPVCILFYLKLLDRFSIKNMVASVLVFYLLVASAHPGIIICSFYFFATIGIFHLMKNRDELNKIQFKKFITTHLAFSLLFCLLAIGLIIGYSDILPHFIRGEKVALADALLYPTTLPSWMSIVLPMSTVKNDTLFQTDISMRNVYMGLTVFIFLIASLIGKKTAWQKLFLWLGLTFVLLSLGGIFKTFAYNFIPYIGYIRLNGEFRLFALICGIIVGSIQLEKYLSFATQQKSSIHKIISILQILVLGLVIFSGVKLMLGDGFFFQRASTATSGLVEKMKSIIDKIGFYDTIWIQGIIQIIILQIIKIALENRKLTLLITIVAADLILASLLNLPFTGVGKASVATIQQVINQAPVGIPIPANKPTGSTSTIPQQYKDMIGDWSFYNKEIGTRREIPYPIVLKNMRAYFDEIEKGNHQYLDSAYLFVENKSAENQIKVTKFTGNTIDVEVVSSNNGKLVLQQNFYPYWTANTTIKSLQEGQNFMSFPIQKGEQTLQIQFNPKSVKTAMFISLIVFVTLLLLLIFVTLKPVSPSLRQPPLDP